MNGIRDFIATAAKQLDQPEDQTRQATGALLSTLKAKVDAGDFEQLVSAIPGTADLMAEPVPEPAAAGAVGGMMGNMAGKLGGADAGGGALGLMGMIQQTGFSPAKLGGLVTQFMALVKGKAGDGLAQKLLSQLPELASLAK